MAFQWLLRGWSGRKRPYLEVNSSDEVDHIPARSTKAQRSFLFVLIFSIIINIVLSCALLLLLARYRELLADDVSILRKTSAYSPVFDKFAISIHETRINGTFLDEGSPPNPFRLLPSPEADAAWETIAEPLFAIFDGTEMKPIIPVGVDPSTLARVPEAWGYGPDAYLTQFDLTHQLHCLNMLRKAAFPNYYTLPRSKVYQDEHKMHCVDILLQDLKCTATVDVIPHVWFEGQGWTLPDFSIKKQCRNGDEILNWMKENEPKGLRDKSGEIKQPVGVKLLPLAPKLTQWLKDLDDIEAAP